jgi:integrase
VLSEQEVRTLWNGIERTDLNMSLEMRKALKLVLLTGQRPGEVAGMHTSEIDGEWWTIPAERAKNGQVHRVYLTATALGFIAEAIAEVKRLRKIPAGKEYSGFVFPSPHKKKEQPIGETALPIAVMRNLAYPKTDKKGNPLFDKDGKPVTENRLGIEQFTPHDLRRTTATFMSKAGFMDEVIDSVLNHKKKGIIKTYNQNKYDTEKQQALEAWENKLTIILAGDKVVDMQQEREKRKTAA